MRGSVFLTLSRARARFQTEISLFPPNVALTERKRSFSPAFFRPLPCPIMVTARKHRPWRAQPQAHSKTMSLKQIKPRLPSSGRHWRANAAFWAGMRKDATAQTVTFLCFKFSTKKPRRGGAFLFAGYFFLFALAAISPFVRIWPFFRSVRAKALTSMSWTSLFVSIHCTAAVAADWPRIINTGSILIEP